MIKIYSSTKGSKSTNNQDSVQAFKLPLSFCAEKKYYTPKYKYCNDTFYKTFGTVDWKPQLNIDENGNLSVKIKRPRTPITLFIEGIANDGSFVFEEKTISLN